MNCLILTNNVFNFRLLGRGKDEPSFKQILEVSVEVDKGRGTDVLYPTVIDHKSSITLIGPLLGELVRDMPAYFHCKVKGSQQVSITIASKFRYFNLSKCSCMLPDVARQPA